VEGSSSERGGQRPLGRFLTNKERGKGGLGLMCHVEEKEMGVLVAWRHGAGRGSGTRPAGAGSAGEHRAGAQGKGGSSTGCSLMGRPGVRRVGPAQKKFEI
jgi:hypothetical protein